MLLSVWTKQRDHGGVGLRTAGFAGVGRAPGGPEEPGSVGRESEGREENGRANERPAPGQREREGSARADGEVAGRQPRRALPWGDLRG